MKNKQISIIIATYNAASTIKKCLESIAPQKTDQCEILIIDGISTDDTLRIVKSYEGVVDRFISELDTGVYDAWNKGIKLSQGEWIMFIGADDILLPNAINDYLKILNNHDTVKDVDYICAKNEYIDKNGNLLKILGSEPSWNKMRKINVAAHVASLHSRDRLFNEIGLYDLNFKICADYELLLRKGKKLRYLFISSHIARMMVGGMSFSLKAIIETFHIRAKHSGINPFFNGIIFLVNWVAFTLFVIRKKSAGAKL